MDNHSEETAGPTGTAIKPGAFLPLSPLAEGGGYAPTKP
jgi:hypothetical protein